MRKLFLSHGGGQGFESPGFETTLFEMIDSVLDENGLYVFIEGFYDIGSEISEEFTHRHRSVGSRMVFLKPGSNFGLHEMPECLVLGSYFILYKNIELSMPNFVKNGSHANTPHIGLLFF